MYGPAGLSRRGSRTEPFLLVGIFDQRNWSQISSHIRDPLSFKVSVCTAPPKRRGRGPDPANCSTETIPQCSGLRFFDVNLITFPPGNPQSLLNPARRMAASSGKFPTCPLPVCPFCSNDDLRASASSLHPVHLDNCVLYGGHHIPVFILESSLGSAVYAQKMASAPWCSPATGFSSAVKARPG